MKAFRIFWRFLYLLLLFESSLQTSAQLANPRSVPAHLREFAEADYTVTDARQETVKVDASTITIDFSLSGRDGMSVRGRLRVPRTARSPHPLAFLTVGLETGKEVVGMIEGYDSVMVASIDYPFRSGLDFSGLGGLLRLLEVNADAARSISSTLFCLEWLLQKPEVDTANVSLVAVSFGVFSGVPAAVLEQRISRLVIVEAGGDLELIIMANAKRLGSFLPPWLAGLIGQFVLGRYDPDHYIDDFAPRPVLIVASAADEFFPEESIHSLYQRARQPKEILWHQQAHVMPDQQDRIRELTRLVAQKLYGNPLHVPVR